MAEVSDRDSKGRFVKGKKPGPGRPRLNPEIRKLADEAPTRIREILDNGSTPVKVKADLLKWCYEQVNGKAKQQVDMDANLKGGTTVVAFEGLLEEWSR